MGSSAIGRYDNKSSTGVMARNLPVTSVKTSIAPVMSASDVSAPMPHKVVPRARSASSPMASSVGGICMDLVVQAAPAWMATP